MKKNYNSFWGPFLLFLFLSFFVTPYDVLAQKKKDKKGKVVKEQVKYDSIAKASDDIELVVNGEGSDLNDATAKALRNAIEQTYGTFVSASSTIINDDLVKDEIATVASGNIKAYKVLSSSQLPSGLTSVSVQAMVSIGKLVSYVQSHGGSAEFAGQTFTMNIKMRELDRENEYKALSHMYLELKEIAPFLFDYSIQLGEPQVGNPSSRPIYIKPKENLVDRWRNDYPSNYTLPVSVKISLNENYNNWLYKLRSVLNSLSMSESEKSVWEQNGMNTFVFSLFGSRYLLRNNYSRGSCMDECVKLINKTLPQWELVINEGLVRYKFFSLRDFGLKGEVDLLKLDGDNEAVIGTPMVVRVDNPGFELLITGKLPRHYYDEKGAHWKLGLSFDATNSPSIDRRDKNYGVNSWITEPEARELVKQSKGRGANPELIPIRFNGKWYMSMLLPLSHKEMNEFRTIEVKAVSETH